MRWKTLFVGILLLSASAVSAVAGQMAIEWYVNVRFAYSIAYPSETFIPQGEAANAGGQMFISRDGKAPGVGVRVRRPRESHVDDRLQRDPFEPQKRGPELGR